MAKLQERMLRAAKLDVTLYQEVKSDSTAMTQATSVVALSALASGLGNVEAGGLNGIVAVTVLEFLGWYVLTYLVYFIGTKFVPEPQTKTTPEELLRALGFARAPGVIRIFALAPGLEVAAPVVAGIWMLVAMVIAIRQALGYESIWRAVGVCILGLLLQAVIVIAVASRFIDLPQ